MACGIAVFALRYGYGLLHIFLGKEFISLQLGKGGFTSILKATILGIPLPVCSCGVIPLATALKKDGAHKSSVLSFLVSTPTTGVDSILATHSLLGPLFAIFRPLAALVCGITLGVSDYFFEGRKEKAKLIPQHSHHKAVNVLRFKCDNFIFCQSKIRTNVFLFIFDKYYCCVSNSWNIIFNYY